MNIENSPKKKMDFLIHLNLNINFKKIQKKTKIVKIFQKKN
jgi:hypothetical protein